LTSVYKCNRCGEIMTFDEDKFVILNLGAGRQEGGFENNKVDDLCPDCYASVENFIQGIEANPKPYNIAEAQSFLREQGYISYKTKLLTKDKDKERKTRK
jgi:hypothetical protein